MDKLSKQPVFNPHTHKETRKTVFGITVTLTERAGQVRFGRNVKNVYFSNLTNRWCFV